ncbi:uncharacterized protein LAJ45_00660 [Morchella importuna]|uniref:Uncharacterized protein n=1 Tax=Morchella conica CCBAS932 TaxID=1392247 RepID=A0A3N4L479_9PEZI|nr:uncharacterized protein LAJ45_00660 [Morchella importuna]KAH8155650.1 hypothetical protein LAJ45_00660 [Morchella importuna]RPB16319.1 hypothetical protein P167DRAFT_602519 [Morchella conica CCBAS932]
MAQADPAIIARAFTDLGAQIPLISNHPTVQTLDQVQNFQEVRGQFRRHDEQFTQLQRTLDGMERGLDEMRREFRLSLDQISRDQTLLPLRLYNASCGNIAHLRYPVGVQAQAITRDNLLTFTVLECQQLAVALGLPALLPNVTVMDRRKQIASYLGVSI